jgi:hypothetical protein
VAVENIQITERDLEILRQVHKHRFLRSNHIVALLNSSAQMILRRLQLLYYHGYLDRPRSEDPQGRSPQAIRPQRSAANYRELLGNL